MSIRIAVIMTMLPKNPRIESYLLDLAVEFASDADGCVERLNGFLHGLWAAELIDTEQRDDLVRIANGGLTLPTGWRAIARALAAEND